MDQRSADLQFCLPYEEFVKLRVYRKWFCGTHKSAFWNACMGMRLLVAYHKEASDTCYPPLVEQLN